MFIVKGMLQVNVIISIVATNRNLNSMQKKEHKLNN